MAQAYHQGRTALSPAMPGSVQALVDGSPHQVLPGWFLARFQKDAGRGGNLLPVQRLTDEEELPVQGKRETVQRVEEDEELPLQGRFETAQRVEDDEELLQAKFETVQRVEDEELPLQGKLSEGKVAQRAGEEAPRPNNTGLPDGLKSGVEALFRSAVYSINRYRGPKKPTGF
jgi:hypothetical protein